MKFTPKMANGEPGVIDQIFKLRVEAWDKSECNIFINKNLYPNGLSDELDNTATHWYIEDNGKVVGCVRRNELESLSEFKEGKNFEKFKNEISSGKFIFYSKIAVHPDYQHKDLAHLLASAVVKGFDKSGAKFGLTLIYLENFAEKYGFKYLGPTILGTPDHFIPIRAYILYPKMFKS